MSNVIELLMQALRERGDAPALHIATRRGDRGEVRTTSFAQMRILVAQAQRRLKRAGVRPGSSLLVLSDVSAETYAMIVAAVALGATIVFAPPMPTKLRALAFVRKQRADFALVRASGKFLRGVLMLMGIKTIAVDQAAVSASQPANIEPADMAPADIEIVAPAGIGDRAALISHSSGTTGAPKPIVRTHGKLARQFVLMDKYLRGGADSRGEEKLFDEGSRVDFTYMGVMALLNMGRGWTSLIPVDMDYTDPAVSRELGKLVDRFRPARLTGSATFVVSALRGASKEGLTAVRQLVLGGAPTDAAALTAAARAVPQAHTLIFYGSTEAEPIAILPVAGDIAQQYEGHGYPVGYPIAEIELTIDTQSFRASDAVVPYPIGEILVRGAHVITAAADGWLRTGDTGYLDASGQLWLTGRAQEAIANGAGALPTYLLEKVVNALPAIERSALIRHGAGARLYLELGAGAQLDAGVRAGLTAELERLALSGVSVQRIDRIPLDSRHRCKINRLSLERRA